MSRRTASLRGSYFQPPPPRPPVTAPTWYKLPLQTCKLWCRDGNGIFGWDKSSDSTNTLLFLFLGMHKETAGEFSLLVRNQVNTVLLFESVPIGKNDLEIRFSPEIYSIDMRVFRTGSSTMVLARWTFVLDLAGSVKPGPMRGVWDRFSRCVQQMPVDQLRYVNLHRSLVPVASPASEFNLRNLASRVIQPESSNTVMDLYLPNMGIVLTFTGTIALANYQMSLEWIRTGRMIAQASTPAPPTRSPLPPADPNDPTAVAEEFRQRRKETAALAAVCGYCYGGTVPSQLGSISRRRHRKAWIGCQSGLDCPQDNFWFHLTKECAGLSAEQAPTRNVWWCETCRVDRPRASELGLELRNLLDR